MKKYLEYFYYSLPFQLVVLHFRRYQVFLLFWFILFATVSGSFMRPFGANALFLSPEYLGKVNFLSTFMVGVAIAIFVMAWNIATFILHARHIKFLATTAQPFLKFYINNAVIPLLFLVFYCYKAVMYSHHHQLLSWSAIVWLILGFGTGFLLITSLSFFYFFGADKRIFKTFAPFLLAANNRYIHSSKRKVVSPEKLNSDMDVKWFLSAKLGLRRARDVRYYSAEFLDTIFKKHHIAAVVAVFAALAFLFVVGYLMDNPVFVFPAAASVTILFSILISVAAATSFFFRSWSVPLVILVYLFFNFLYRNQIIETRNQAYGLDYTKKHEWPVYSEAVMDTIASAANIESDKLRFISRLDAWKLQQSEEKPVAYILCVSGGGLRSANFTMNVLQQLDSITSGNFLKQTVFISGASGGMLGAAYFRELYLQRLQHPDLYLQDKKYSDAMGKDLLNPLFSSLVSRDLISATKTARVLGYTYKKDRGYAFEKQFNTNTRNTLQKTIGSYQPFEDSGKIPSMLISNVITMDGRRMLIGTMPYRFLMRNLDTANELVGNIDAIDFQSYFHLQQPQNLGLTSALRMNATFPYVLPNVWMPTRPIIDVMDAGLRDNTGLETALKMIVNFKAWFKQNTAKVVVIQIRDREMKKWEVDEDPPGLLNTATKPFLLLQNNWYRMQDYTQGDQLAFAKKLYGSNLHFVWFQYIPAKQDAPASLSFHLTTAEKKDIRQTLFDSLNLSSFRKIRNLYPVTEAGNTKRAE